MIYYIYDYNSLGYHYQNMCVYIINGQFTA